MSARRTVGLAGAALLLFLGALFWARGRDPFQRDWVSLRVAGQSRVRGVAVLPKAAARPLPVVVYLHGSGNSLLKDGNDLRQMAELGLAVVALDYCQTNEAVCEAQFAALLGHVSRQRWADTNATAWVGFSLGAERATRFWLRHPEARPRLLVRLAGGPVEELKKSEGRSSTAEGKATGTANFESRTVDAHPPLPPKSQAPTVLLLHGGQDEVFPAAEASRVAEALRAAGVAVELQVLPGQSHGFGENRAGVFRAIGEYCLTRLRGPDALARYRSVGTWKAAAWPLWVYWLAALVWVAAWRFASWKAERGDRTNRNSAERPPRPSLGVRVRQGSGVMRGLAWGLAAVATGLSAVHLLTPRLAVGEGALRVARRFLIQPSEREDFEYLAGLSCWDGQRLGTLLEHAHLARYNRSLVSWTVDDALYREDVLAPTLGGQADGNLRWRRALWESLYPRVRKETSAAAAAEAVVRHLRERITIVAEAGGVAAVEELWRRQRADPHGFAALTVAGLRAVGIPARLDSNGRAEMWAEGKWQPAPQPVVNAVEGWGTPAAGACLQTR